MLSPKRDVLRKLSVDDEVGDRTKRPVQQGANHRYDERFPLREEIEDEKRRNHGKWNSAYEERVVRHQGKGHFRMRHDRECHTRECGWHEHDIGDEHQAFMNDAIVPLADSDCDMHRRIEFRKCYR